MTAGNHNPKPKKAAARVGLVVAHAIKEGNLSLMCSGLVGDNMDPKTNVAPYRDLGFTQEEVREMLAQWADSIKTGAGKKLKRCVTMVNHAEVIIGKADQDVLNAASSSVAKYKAEELRSILEGEDYE